MDQPNSPENTYISDKDTFFLTKAKYPIVDNYPTARKIFSNINAVGYGVWAGSTVFGYYWGFITSRKVWKVAMARKNAVCLFFGGALYAHYESAARLAGYKPNAEEVRKYGVMSEKEQQVKEFYNNYIMIETIDQRAVKYLDK